MDIYLLRHGIADEGRAGQPDSDRALTAEGRKKLRGVLRAAATAGVRPSLIMTSPYKRALQTAELAAEILEYGGDLVRTRALEPGSRPEAAWDEIRAHKDEQDVLLAGHEPLFSSLTAYLLGSTDLRVDFKKGGLLCLEVDRFVGAPKGVLKWYLTPKLAT
ncbi:MAG TPA: histidine phosphatase family protein [Bryobacteraceae bacterium]|nr:histidine phosphatase family protein [Bryobacteraceae bacterium]